MSKMKYCCAGVSQKWVFAVMGFFAIVCAFAMRMCLPLTIPKMVKPAEHRLEYHDSTCPGPNVTLSKPLPRNSSSSSSGSLAISNPGTYDWSEYTQGIILGSFYWGYVITHIPGGMIAEKFGGKHTLGFGIVATAVCTILTPASVSWGGAAGLIWLRIVMGLFEGITQPAISVMLAQWIPADERSKISSFVFMGSVFGILLIPMGLGSLLRLMNWPGVYYVFGGLGVLWYLFWLLLCYNNPREHPFISEKEAAELNEKLKEHTHDNAPSVPWRHLLGSAPFWALVAGSVGRDWGGYTLMSDFPKYTMNVLKFTDAEVGYVYLITNVTTFLSCLVFSWLSDWLIERKHLSRTNVRKLMATLGLFVHSIFVILLSYAGCNKLHFNVIMTVLMIFGAASTPGIKANVLDLSPNYAGTVMAISHGVAGLCGIGGPYVVGLLVPNQTLSEWRMVYWIIFIVCVITNLIFVIYGSGDVQEWNDPKFDRKQKASKAIEVKEIEKLLVKDKIQIVTTAEDLKN